MGLINPLINPRTMKNALANISAPTPAQAEIARLWAENIRNGEIYKKTESNKESLFHSRILEGLLGFRPSDGSGVQTYEPKQKMGSGSADIALGEFSGRIPKIMAAFELKGADTFCRDGIIVDLG